VKRANFCVRAVLGENKNGSRCQKKIDSFARVFIWKNKFTTNRSNGSDYSFEDFLPSFIYVRKMSTIKGRTYVCVTATKKIYREPSLLKFQASGKNVTALPQITASTDGKHEVGFTKRV
jgi:hypothetical protein